VSWADESSVACGGSGKFLMSVDDSDVNTTFLQKPAARESDDPRPNDHYVFGPAWMCAAPWMTTHRSSLKKRICAILHISTSQPIFKVAAKYESGDRSLFPIMI
jgi:hypothetical protein